MTIFRITFSQVSILFLFSIVGYLLRKAKKLPDAAPDTLSALLLSVFLPATCFNTTAKHCTAEVLLTKTPLLLLGLVLVLLCLGLAVLCSRVLTKHPRTREVYIFTLVVSNIGYLGYPLIEAVFGSELLFDFIVLTLPLNLYIYSFGMNLFRPEKKLSLRAFASPTMLSILIGMAVGLLGIPLPAFLSGAIDVAAGMMAPCAMILTGAILSDIRLSAVFTDPRTYLICFLRLVGWPALFGLLAYLLGLPSDSSLLLTVMLCLPAGLNSVVFSRAWGGDSESAVKICFLSNLLGLITIPLVFAAASAIFV